MYLKTIKSYVTGITFFINKVLIAQLQHLH